jgi:hypothetical protein
MNDIHSLPELLVVPLELAEPNTILLLPLIHQFAVDAVAFNTQSK